MGGNARKSGNVNCGVTFCTGEVLAERVLFRYGDSAEAVSTLAGNRARRPPGQKYKRRDTMKDFGNKVAKRRKDLGMTQIEFADALSVTRQTVSRWEAGTVIPDVDKIGDIANILQVSCDYLLKDEITEMCTENNAPAPSKSLSRLLTSVVGKKVKLTLYDDEEDIDLYDAVAEVLDFEGNWMKVCVEKKKKEPLEKVIPVSAIFSIEIVKEDK